MERLEELVDGDTFLVCCGLANNEIGTVQDVAAVADVAHRKGAFVLSDCVQALGKIPVDVKSLGVDYAAFSAHKIRRAKGRRSAPRQGGISASLPSSTAAARSPGLRAGTESVHNIAGFAAACEELTAMLAQAERVRATPGRTRLRAPSDEARPRREHPAPRTPWATRLSVTFSGVDNAMLMAALDSHGVAVSAGSACHTQSNEPSHVLKAIGLSDAQARQTLRISLGPETSLGEIRYALAVFRAFFAERLPVNRSGHPSATRRGPSLSAGDLRPRCPLPFRPKASQEPSQCARGLVLFFLEVHSLDSKGPPHHRGLPGRG